MFARWQTFTTSGARPDVVWLHSTGALGESASRGNLNWNCGPTFRGRKNQAFLASARRPPTVAAAKLTSRNTVEKIFDLFDWSMRQMSRPQPARPPLATRTYLDHCKPVARRRATKKAWLGGPKFGPQNWVPNLDPKFGPQTLPQLGHCLEKKDRGPFFGALPGVRKWSQLCKQVGGLSSKKGQRRESWQTCRKLPNISPLGV